MMVECTSPLKGQLAADVNPPSCLRLNSQELTISRCGDLEVMWSYVRLWAKAQLWVQKSLIQTLNQELLFLGWFCLFIHSSHGHKRDGGEVRMSHQCRCTVPSPCSPISPWFLWSKAFYVCELMSCNVSHSSLLLLLEEMSHPLKG